MNPLLEILSRFGLKISLITSINRQVQCFDFARFHAHALKIRVKKLEAVAGEG